MSPGPSFRKVWEAAQAECESRAGRRRVRTVGAGLAVALAGVLLYLAVPEASEPDVDELIAFSREVESWQEPLSFLLETPGYEHLATTPSFGAPLDEWGIPPLANERTQS